MGAALVGGLLADGWGSANEIVVAERFDERAAELAARYPGVRTVASAAEVPEAPAGVVLAVKPAEVEDACAGIRSGAPGVPVLSILAGVRLARLEGMLAPSTPVVRAMPNLPAVVGAGAAAIAPGELATGDHLAWAEAILGAVGIVVRLSEDQL